MNVAVGVDEGVGVNDNAAMTRTASAVSATAVKVAGTSGVNVAVGVDEGVKVGVLEGVRVNVGVSDGV